MNIAHTQAKNLPLTLFGKHGLQYLRSFPLSYAQVYFSNSIWLGLVLLVVSFADVGVGLSGVLSIIVCQLCGRFFNFDQRPIFDGSYTFNALMVGLAMGSLYQWSVGYLFALVMASMFTFFLSVWLTGRMALSGLPVLSLPFLITIWISFLALSNFSGFRLEGKEAFSLDHWYPEVYASVSRYFDQFAGRDLIHLYLRSLSAIFFQYNDLAGLVIAVALLLQSRMSFALTIYGFLIGYCFYYFLEGDFTPLIYSYIGFNFMLAAIALGGFFIVPSLKSHLLLFFVVPVTALLLSAFYTLFAQVSLPLYSLPFNLIVLLMVGVLRMRYASAGIQLVLFQQFSPEKNHYKTKYQEKRFAGQSYIHIGLPIIGEWYISQGHDGAITHREGWKYAWDFDVRDDHNATYRAPGFDLDDYYCYELPVVAPAYGWVVAVIDGIPDNLIKDINLEQNWGNTIIIQHADGLYSKISHLKPYSIKVREGAYVRAGELIGLCGSSGRSPEPHLHFQLQATPYVGSQTLKYPIAYYLTRDEQSFTFHSFSIPKEGEQVRNVLPSPIMARAYQFITGQELTWTIQQAGVSANETWIASVDAYNKQYLYAKESGAVAYFMNDGVMFTFTDFFGDRRSFLYHFYCCNQRVLLGCYSGAAFSEPSVPESLFPSAIRFIHDFTAPFFHYLTGEYRFRIHQADNYLEPRSIVFETSCTAKALGFSLRQQSGTITLNEQGFAEVILKTGTKTLTAQCVS